MDIISCQEFSAICQDVNTHTIKFGKVDQPKVFEKDGHTIIKLFYPKKRKFSSDHIRPRAIRFCRNVKKLDEWGYNVPVIDKIQFCPELKMYLLYYPKIQGCNIRSLAKNGNLDLMPDVAHLLADLHEKGIFFRSIHLENLLYQPDGKIALLDVTDVKFKSSPLSLYLRYRNIRHLFSEPLDKEVWQTFGISNFMKEYFRLAGLPRYSHLLLNYMMKRFTNQKSSLA